MNKIKIKNINKRLVSSIIAGTITLTLVGCGKKEEDANTEIITQPTSIVYMENDEEKINLDKVFVLKNVEDNETLFVKYNNENDTHVYDVFTNVKYEMYNGNYNDLIVVSRTVKKLLGTTHPAFIYNKEYTYQNINNYIYSNTEDLNKYNSYEVFKQAFINANNLNIEELNLPDEEMIDLKNLLILNNNDSTLYVKYDKLEDEFVTDIFTNCKYYSESNNTYNLKCGNIDIDGVEYKIQNFITYPYIFENIKDDKISKNVLHESFKKVNKNKEKVLTKQK